VQDVAHPLLLRKAVRVAAVADSARRYAPDRGKSSGPDLLSIRIEAKAGS